MTVKTDSYIVGQSTTDTNNFLLQTNGAGNLHVHRGSTGAGTVVMRIKPDDTVEFPAGRNLLTLETSKPTTSGTSVDFTAIPAWVKRITVMLNGVSTSGTSNYLLQIGNTTFAVSGYLGVVNALGVTATNFSSGFMVANSVAATSICHGVVTLQHMGSNIWTMQGSLGRSDSTTSYVSAGQVPLAGVLDRLRLTTVAGTDTFDAGSINIMYEG